MAWVFGGKKFGQYTYEHWFDDDSSDESNAKNTAQEEVEHSDIEKSNDNEPNNENTVPHKP